MTDSKFFRDGKMPSYDTLFRKQTEMLSDALIRDDGVLATCDDGGDEALALIECTSHLFDMAFQQDCQDTDPDYVQYWHEFLLCVFTDVDASGFRYGEYSSDGDARFEFIVDEEDVTDEMVADLQKT